MLSTRKLVVASPRTQQSARVHALVSESSRSRSKQHTNTHTQAQSLDDSVCMGCVDGIGYIRRRA